MPYLLFLLALLLTTSCADNFQPKPKAMLRLSYPKPTYAPLEVPCAFSFEKNEKAILKKQNNCNLDIYYPQMKATIYLTYKNVNGNLPALLRDAQKLTYEHVVKASNIIEQPYIDDQKKTFGMFYEVDGNAASQSQFYITDSISHFITGSIYFRVKPNFDSILPAANYLKEDIRHIMETTQWKTPIPNHN